ncbi:MAG TPA: hypothetical protein VMH87_00300 [Pseudomonadales bacterium]|nr:hypothetical protein [Pseudomonadales bacterium]
MPNRHVPGSVSTVKVEPPTNRNPGAKRLSVLRTTLTGADEPYNGRGDSRHDYTHSFTRFTGELLITSTLA